MAVVARRVEPLVEAGHRLVVPGAPVRPVAAVAEAGRERRVVDDHRGPGVDQHLFDRPPVEPDERRLPRDDAALRHAQGRGDAVGAGHRDVLAGGVDGRRRLQVGVEAALLAGVVGHAHRPDLDEPEPRDGVEQPRIDVPSRRVHDLGVGWRLHVRPHRGDEPVADDDDPRERLGGQGVHGPAPDGVGLGGGGGGAEGDGGGPRDGGDAERGGRAERAEDAGEDPPAACRAGEVAEGGPRRGAVGNRASITVSDRADRAGGAGGVDGAGEAGGGKRCGGPAGPEVAGASHRSSSGFFGASPSFARWACFSASTAARRSRSSSTSKYSLPSTQVCTGLPNIVRGWPSQTVRSASLPS